METIFDKIVNLEVYNYMYALHSFQNIFECFI